VAAEDARQVGEPRTRPRRAGHGDQQVQSVLGPVDAQALGVTLMHEHVALRTPGFAENYPFTYPRDSVIEQAAAELSQLRAKGVRTIVDLTTVDLGRDAGLLAEVSRRSGMNIIAATGAYHHVPTYFKPRTAERISQLFIGDLEREIAETGVRAGVIKCAIDEPGMTDDIRKLTEAAALAHLATGALISTHTSPASRTGLAQATVLAGMGVDLSRVVIGHCGDTTDDGYLRELLGMGANLGLDRFGLTDYLDSEKRCEIVAALCAGGFDDRLVLSHDASCFSDAVSRRFRDQHLPDWRMDHLVDDVLPRLRQLGVTESAIMNMTVANPARLLPRAPVQRAGG
jgi:phosphotriesterase-related protein